METKRKIQYEAPALQVVEINVEGTLCQSPNNVMVWMLSGETFTSSTSEWGRSGYGDAQSF
jgi:hypothetical protein